MGRNQGRVDRIEAHRAKLLARLKAQPKHPKAEKWRARIEEFNESLRNFHEHGRETMPTGNTESVTISVPVKDFALKPLAPGD